MSVFIFRSMAASSELAPYKFNFVWFDTLLDCGFVGDPVHKASRQGYIEDDISKGTLLSV